MPGSHWRHAIRISSLLHSRLVRPHIPCHVVRPATAIALDWRERRRVQSATRRRRARHVSAAGANVDRVIGTHARDMPKVATILQQKKTKHPITIIHRAFVMMTKYANVRSIFGSSLGCAASGTRLGCGRCPRTNSTVWRRRCAARCTPTTRGPVCGSYSRAVPETYSSRQCGRLSLQHISIHHIGVR